MSDSPIIPHEEPVPPVPAAQSPQPLRVPVEIVEPPAEPKRGNAPVHFLSAFATIALDGIWGLIEMSPLSLAMLPALIPAMLGLGGLCALTVTLVQRFVDHDTWGASAAKGLVLGIAAGVPFPIVGTAIGAPLLVWSGVQEIRGLLRSGKP